ncbi:MAG: hypothetical protein IKU29_03855 [Parabacteroides sp.]|nr:hypothetical protein [Parabacteroides sp.]
MALDVQTRIIRTDDIVNYSGIIKSAYRPEVVQSEPFIGIKILVRDSQANKMAPAQRIGQLDQFLGTPNPMNGMVPLAGTGCCIRETKFSIMPDGFWVITLPVPRSMFGLQLQNLIKVLQMLKQIGIAQEGYVEINVSGRCPMGYTEACLNNLSGIIPSNYLTYLDQNDDSPYKMGKVERINNNFICFRTRWNFNSSDPNLYQNISALSMLISAMYR